VIGQGLAGQHPLPLWRRPLNRTASLLVGVVSVAVLITAWHVVTVTAALISPLSLPPPQDVLDTFLRFLGSPFLGATLWGHAGASLKIVLGGWLLGGIVGLPLGVFIGWSSRARWLLFPVFQLLRPVPPLAWIPLAIVWFGLGDSARIYVVFLAAVVPWTINSIEAVHSVDGLLVHAARTLGASDVRILARVILPTALPTFVAGARISLGNAWTTLIAAELLAASQGLGFVALNAARTLDSDILLVSVAIMGVLGAVFSVLMRLLQRVVAPWAETS